MLLRKLYWICMNNEKRPQAVAAFLLIILLLHEIILSIFALKDDSICIEFPVSLLRNMH